MNYQCFNKNEYKKFLKEKVKSLKQSQPTFFFVYFNNKRDCLLKCGFLVHSRKLGFREIFKLSAAYLQFTMKNEVNL